MGLMQQHDNCWDCSAELVCDELRATLGNDQIDFSIAPGALVLLLPSLAPIVCRYCPHCGRQLHLWHSETGWHLTEVDA